MSSTKELPTSYSFACGGWLKSYLFGAAKALQEHNLHVNATFLGSSAGALTATGLALDCDFDAIRDFVVNDIVPRAHASPLNLFRVRSYLLETIDNFGNLHKFEQANEKQNLRVAYTSLRNMKAKRMSSFCTKEELRSGLIASCCATPIAGLPFKLGEEWVFDGGLTDFQPVLDGKTITVSPFYCTSADIRPSRYVPMWWAVIPPVAENVAWLYDLGYEDTLMWAYKNGYLQKKPVLQKHASKYDAAWKTSIGRFLGYQSLENGFLDMFFVFFVAVLWKPLALALMYAEVCARALLYGSKAAIFGTACKLVTTLVISAAASSISPFLLPYKDFIFSLFVGAATVLFFILIALAVGGKQMAAQSATQDWKNCVACMRNLASLSLLLHSVPVIGSAVPIKGHFFFLEHSMVYRLTNHFL